MSAAERERAAAAEEAKQVLARHILQRQRLREGSARPLPQHNPEHHTALSSRFVPPRQTHRGMAAAAASAHSPEQLAAGEAGLRQRSDSSSSLNLRVKKLRKLDRTLMPGIGAELPVQALDGNSYPAIVEQIRNKTGQPPQYYVHYKDFDRRMDEWVTLDRLDLDEYRRRFVEDDTPGAEGRATATPSPLPDAAPAEPGQEGKKITRLAKRRREEDGQADQHEGQNDDEDASHKLVSLKYITKIHFGEFEINTWYFSPFPEDFARMSTLYICEWCLKYYGTVASLACHKCETQSPPGREIYRKGAVSVFEIDGAQPEHKLYCQNLCLIAKLFLFHKTLFFDPAPFYFYVMSERDERGHGHVVGYFSKEKDTDHNVACILTLPHHQRKGYGRFLIEFSYHLSRLEGKQGTPERPLSDLGLISYRKHWAWLLMQLLRDIKGTVSIENIASHTGMTAQDVFETLQWLGLADIWKPGRAQVCMTPAMLDACAAKHNLR